MGQRRYQRDVLPCVCGRGTMLVEVTTFGIWRVEGLLERCPSCGSGNFTAAREQLIVASAQLMPAGRTGERN